MRPVLKQFRMHFGFNEAYPPELAYLTHDGKHKGFDYLTPKETRVFAPVDGVFNYIGWKRGYGNCIYIKFWSGWAFTRRTFRVILAHLSEEESSIVVGQKCTKGQLIGYSGDSGMAVNHPHLHVQVEELIKGTWVPIDPAFVVGKD